MSTEKPTKDAEIISHFGGPAALARRIGLTDRYATQRVSNWVKRGIPAAIRLKYRSIFDKAEREIARQA